ncbi:MAG TPA: polysaccharide biosynthesis tyrosine autokinase [Aeromicrobium sp.]|nr:polysaccharide biosynthesis tyrosine autokinase [Aeromicrobium sp.]
MELNDYLRILRNHWLGVVVIVLACVSLAGLYNLTQPQVFAANAKGFVSAGGSSSEPALSSVSDSLAKSRAKSYIDLATSRATAQTVINDLGLNESPASLIGRISAEQPADTVSIDITARAPSPREAQELADAWVSALQEQVEKIENPDGKNESPIRIVPVEAAARPTAPVSPNVTRNLAIGLGAGVLLGFAYALVRSQLDRRIRSTSAVEKEFGVSVVGTIPKAPVLKHGTGEPAQLAVVSGNSRGQDQSAAEAFRKLRTNLQFMSVDDPPRVIVVTSPKPSDGKSTVTANLAAAIAASGSPVILIDGDLRRPTVATSFGLVEGAGLTDVLIGRVGIDEVLQPHAELPGLSVLAAGGIPPNPSELLGSQTMGRLLTELSERAIVLVDAPPLLPVTDGAVLTAMADGAFVVISAGRTLDTELAASLEYLGNVNGQVLGIVFNGVTARDVYASGYYYSQNTDKKSGKKSGKKSKSSRGEKSAGKRVASKA